MGSDGDFTYTRLDGRTLSLSGLTAAERAFFDRCVRAYRSGSMEQDFVDLANLIAGRDNPLVDAADGWITTSVWDHPLFQAVSDLEHRLAIRVGVMGPAPGDSPELDPLADRGASASETARHSA